MSTEASMSRFSYNNKNKIRIRSVLKIRTSIVFVALLYAVSAQAFKVDTHVWIGQRVLNDAMDGNLTFNAALGYGIAFIIVGVLAPALIITLFGQ